MNLLDVSMGFGAGAGGVAALAALLSPGGKRLRRIEHGVVTIWRVVLGAPAEDGLPAQLGVLDRFAAQDKHLAEQDRHLGEQDEHLAKQDDEMAAIKRDLRALKDHITSGGARE